MAITRATKTERREAILEAAGAVFARDGYERSRVDEIARRARVGKGTIYEHFGSKENLFCSYLSHIVQQNTNTLTEHARHEDDPRKALGDLFRGLITSLEAMIPLIGLYIEAWNLASKRKELREYVIATFRDLYTPFADQVAELVREGRRRGQFAGHRPSDVAAMMLAIVDGLAYQALFILDPKDLPRMARRAERFLFQGLEARP